MDTIVISVIIFVVIIFALIMSGSGKKEQTVLPSKKCDGKPLVKITVKPNYKTVSVQAHKYDVEELNKKDYYVFIDTLTIDGDYSDK
jgi:hypothetical protein